MNFIQGLLRASAVSILTFGVIVACFAHGKPGKNKHRAMYVADITYTVVADGAYSCYDLLLFPGGKFGIVHSSDDSKTVEVIGHWYIQKAGHLLILDYYDGTIDQYITTDIEAKYVNIDDEANALVFHQW